MRTGSFGAGRSRSLGFGGTGFDAPRSGRMRNFFTSRRGFGLLGERSREVRFSEARSTAMRFFEDVPVERALFAELFEVRDVFFGLGD